MNFMATKKPAKPAYTSTIKNPVLEDFYTDIDKFMKKSIKKEEYLDNFVSKINKNLYNQMNSSEKIYVNDILTTLDLTNSIKDIPDNYLLENMNKLLKK